MATSGFKDQRGQEEESFLYFAYGSNLLTERIHLQNPSAEFFCVALLQEANFGKDGKEIFPDQTANFLHIEGTQSLCVNCMKFKDFKLDFGNFEGEESEVWHGGIATIFQSPGDEVWGVVWKMNKSNLSSLDKQENAYTPIEVTVYTQEGKEITCRTYQMRNYESAPPSPQYKKVICLGAKENGLPPEYREKLDAIEPNSYRGRVSDEVEDIIRKGETRLIST